MGRRWTGGRQAHSRVGYSFEHRSTKLTFTILSTNPRAFSLFLPFSENVSSQDYTPRLFIIMKICMWELCSAKGNNMNIHTFFPKEMA